MHAPAVIQFTNAVPNCTFVERPRISRRPRTMEKVTLTKNAPHREAAFPGRHFSRRRDATRRPPPSAESHLSLSLSLFPKSERVRSGNLAPAVHPFTDKTRTKIGFRSPNVVPPARAMRLFVIAALTRSRFRTRPLTKCIGSDAVSCNFARRHL